ncbi:hypothetical protein, partial [Neisseria gonorrhoeae]|uniref:hypothetical protein n=3 Tax=Neisseria gonorrhoeae TaxID=485 RepID=UPI001C5AD52E
KDRRASAAVIPAQAGIQSVRFQPYPTDSCRVAVLDSRLLGNDGVFRVAVFCGNDEALDCEDLSLPPLFPRKWESRNEKQQEFIGNDRN